MDPQIKAKIQQNIYYILIAIISLASIIVFPIIGSANNSATIESAFPTTPTGWIFFVVVRVLIIGLNMLIFTNFIQQAKLNVKDNENYKEALKIMIKSKNKEEVPRSPTQYLAKIYTTKGATMILTSLASLFAIGSAVLNYDYMLLIATVFSVIIAIVFGVMEMKKMEVYYCEEYLNYAKMKEMQEAEQIVKEEEKCAKTPSKCVEKYITKGDIKKCLDAMIKNC